MRRSLPLLCLCLLVALLQGCAYGVYDDQRLMDTMSADKKLSTKIKAALLNASFTQGLDIAVYAFYGHVFLVGEVPEAMRDKAKGIAWLYKPRTVTTHWFSHVTRDAPNNVVLATKLRTALIGTSGLSSTRIETEVNAGRVVLLGVVQDEREKELAITSAQKVQGVSSVTSYLMLPQKAGQIDAFRPERVSGKP